MNPVNIIKSSWKLISLGILAILPGCASVLQVDQDMTRISMNQGEIEGVASPYDSSVHVFKAIPYAKPPVGNLRWKPPVQAEPWAGVFKAESFAASCYQEQNTSTFVWRREAFEVSEDCLYLNIWSAENAKNAPVMVWFHGGAHTSGQGHSTIFDGTELAKHGVVLVTINYRLGPFGYLAHPWLAEESGKNSAGNYGEMDKILALEWVRDNIFAFGGDAANVTIFGQSAGSQSVCTLMASEKANGLFHKAIGQSASCLNPTSLRDVDGRERGVNLVDQLRVSSLADLRSAEASDLLDAASKSGWANASRLVVDGDVLLEPHVDIYRRGEQVKVPLLLGSLSNEGHELFPKAASLSADELTRSLSRQFGEDAGELLSLYRHEGTPADIQHAVATDLFMTFGMRRWAEYHEAAGNPVFLYFMDHVPPAFHLYMPDNPVLQLKGGPRSGGAYHSGDLALVFGTVDKVGYDWRDSDREISRQMIEYWTNFAKQGSPGGNGLADWPEYKPEIQSTQQFSTSSVLTVRGIRREKLDVMAKTYGM